MTNIALSQSHQTSIIALFSKSRFWITLVSLLVLLALPYLYWIKYEEKAVREDAIDFSELVLQRKIANVLNNNATFSDFLSVIASIQDVQNSVINKSPPSSDTEFLLENVIKTFPRLESIMFISPEGNIVFNIYKSLNQILTEQIKQITAFDQQELLINVKRTRARFIVVSDIYFSKSLSALGHLTSHQYFAIPIYDANNIYAGAVTLKMKHDLSYNRTSLPPPGGYSILSLDIVKGDWFLNQRNPELSLLSGRTPTGKNVEQDEPDLWKAISSNKKGLFEDHHGIYLYETFMPYVAPSNHNAENWRYSPIMFSQNNVVAVNFTSHKDITSAARTQNHYLALATLILLIVVLSITLTNRAKDIDEIRQGQQTFKDLVELNDAIIDNLEAALIIIDLKGIITRFSHHAEVLFGYQADEVIGSNIRILMRSDIAAKHDDYLANYVKDTLAGMQKIQSILGKARILIAKHKDGSEFPVEIVVSKVPLGDTFHFAGLITNISERLQMQEQLEIALEEAKSASNYKTEFLAHMSHEIRTPLNGVYGTLQLLRNRLKNSEHHNLIEKAIYSSKAMLGLINDILDISKIEANKLEFEEVPFSFLNVIKEVTNDIEETANLKGLTLEVIGIKNFKDGFLGDPLRVRQVLLNICMNAVKFTHKGSVKIIINATQTDQLSFSVRDTGIGMNTEQLERLYIAYEQAERSTARNYGGTGLGMQITQRLVDLMNGKINVQSQIDEGTEVKVTLKIKQIELDSIEHFANEEPPQMTGKDILLVEDNIVNQTVFQAMIELTGANLKIAGDGVEALEIIKQFDPDLIFMDINMPKMRGTEACSHIKTLNPLVPIIALTANTKPEDITEYRKSGFDDYLPKPFEMTELHELLNKYLAS